MTPPNSGNPNLNTMIKEEGGNAETGNDPGNNFGQSNNGNNGSGNIPGQMGQQGQQQQPQQQGQNTNSNSKQCNNAEVRLGRFSLCFICFHGFFFLDKQYMQQQSQIFVFSTMLANKGAEAVLHGQFPSIIAYHCAQPGTKKFLEVIFL